MRDHAILVVGGAGYIGSHVAKLVRKKGYTTVVLDNLSTGHKEATLGHTFVEGSYGDRKLVEQTLQKYKIGTVMHFGAKSIVPDSVRIPLDYYASNVTDTITLLQAMKTQAVKYCVFSSTCATYGEPEKIPIPEELPQKPLNPYGWSKLMIEQILRDMQNDFGLNSSILRYFNAAGADPEGELGEDHRPETHLIPRAFQAVMGKAPALTVFGKDYDTRDGSGVRDYIHVNDLAEAHVLAMENLWKTNKSDDFNLGSEHGSTVFEVLAEMKKVCGKEVPHSVGPRRAGDTPVLIGNSSKAKAVLGWKPKYSLHDIVHTTYQWMEKHPEGF